MNGHNAPSTVHVTPMSVCVCDQYVVTVGPRMLLTVVWFHWVFGAICELLFTLHPSVLIMVSFLWSKMLKGGVYSLKCFVTMWCSTVVLYLLSQECCWLICEFTSVMGEWGKRSWLGFQGFPYQTAPILNKKKMNLYNV